MLSGFAKLLSEGRYRWRHDQVLKAIAEVVSEAIKSNRRHKINFVKAGSSKQPQTKNKVTLLSSAIVGGPGKADEVSSNYCGDKARTRYSNVFKLHKKVIMWELSVLWEENMETTHERKIAKYESLIEQCRVNGWQAICQAVEVECHRFYAMSTSKALTSIGIPGAIKRRTLKNITSTAERATNSLWIRRGMVGVVNRKIRGGEKSPNYFT